MPLINCKVKLSSKWNENCVLTTAANANKAIFDKTLCAHCYFISRRQCKIIKTIKQMI